jgi:hypothetical protein
VPERPPEEVVAEQTAVVVYADEALDRVGAISRSPAGNRLLCDKAFRRHG